jgi:hypothetical protein
VRLFASAARVNYGDPVGTVKPDALERWLVDGELAELDRYGRLRLTERGARLGGIGGGGHLAEPREPVEGRRNELRDGGDTDPDGGEHDEERRDR